MALALYDRVQQTGTANTTVSFTLSGSVTGYQSFSVVGNGNTTYYGATDTSGNWEVGIGTYATGGTLTRTTILASSNSGSAVTFSGTVTVFVTYPSERSVNLDGSGNVSALGTISSGTWQGSTVGVAYGGTGVTSSSGANSVVLRDANQNTTFNNYVAGFAATTAAGGTTVLTVASARNQVLVGSTSQTFQLPNATTLQLGQSFVFINNSSGVLTVKDNASTTIETVPSGGITQLGATSIATSAGSWGAYSFIPAAVDWGTNALNLASTVISGGTWQGGTIASGYGGTGLTTFTAANYALYSTSASALTAGTLPVPAGGTGQTSFSSGYIPYGNSSAALQSSSLLQFNGTYLQVGGGSVLGGATNPITAFSQSANNYVQTYVYNPSTGTSASSDFVAYTNNSTDAHGWADMGFTSSNYADSVYTCTGPNEAYLFGSALNSSYTGNLVYATDSTGSANAHQWYVGGFTQAKSAYKMQLTSSYLELKTPIYVTGSSGTSGYVLQSNGSGSAPSWVAPGGSTILTTTSFTATAGQTTFTVTYTPALLQGVYRNGIKLDPADYTSTSGTAIVLNTGAIVGDNIQVQYFSALATSTTVSSISFGSTGLTPSTATSGAVTVAGTLAVANGGTGVTTSTGSGNVVLSTSPTLVTPVLGTPSSGTLTNCTGYTTANLSGNINLTTQVTGTLPVANGGTGVTTSTGSGNNVLSTSPTLVTPLLGTPTSGTLTNCTGLPVGGISATGTPSSSTYLRGDGSWSAVSSGITVTNDTATASALYPTFTSATSGSISGVSVTSTKLTFVPSTGALTATSMVSSSDERLKTNWRNVPSNFVDRLADVKSGIFDRIDFETTDVGVSAQSLQELLPEAVVSDQKGYLGVNYGNTALLAAIELAKEVKELRAEIKALKAELNK